MYNSSKKKIDTMQDKLSSCSYEESVESRNKTSNH